MKLAAESNSIVTSDGETVTTSLEMEYDSANRLISYNNKKIKYDKDGNMLYGPVNGEMCNLTYDSRNRLISAGNVTYDYDAENTRISVTTTDKKITYVTDVAGEMSQVLESYEKTNDGKKIHIVYVYGNGLIYSYNDDEADSTTTNNKVQDLSSDKSSDKDTDGTTYYHYNNIGSTTKLTDNNGNVIQSYKYGAYGEVLSGDTKITQFLYNGQLGVMTDNNGLYYMRARYYNVNIKRFINQDVVHGSINVSQSLNRYSYVQGNPIKLTDPFGLSPLDRLNWKNLGHAILNGLGLIPVIGEAFDIANAIWYAHDGEYGMAVLSMMSALPMIGNIASGIMTAAKITTASKIVSTVCKVVSNATTFTQAAIGGVNNAKAIVKNMINGKLFSEDTAKNLVSFGINAFTAATSGKNLLSSSKELKKVVGDSVGSKWGKKAKKEPLLEYNLQFFADKSDSVSVVNTQKNVEMPILPEGSQWERNVLNSFAGGKSNLVTYGGGTTLYRVGGKNGGFWSLDPPPSTEYQWRVDFAIKQEFCNDASTLYKMTIPDGSSLSGLEGTVGTQGMGLYDGAHQVYIDYRAVPSDWIEISPTNWK